MTAYSERAALVKQKLDEIDALNEEMIKEVESWVIQAVKNLKTAFPESNFCYAYEKFTDLFVVQVNDLTTFHDEDFKIRRNQVIKSFREKFKEDSILFITPIEGEQLEDPTFKI